jgi:hypothetical protein
MEVRGMEKKFERLISTMKKRRRRRQLKEARKNEWVMRMMGLINEPPARASRHRRRQKKGAS